MRRAAALAAVILALAVIAAPAGAAPLAVTVDYQAFTPYTLEALTGDTVTWNNGSGRTHTVTADGGAFDSGDLLDGHSFAYTFTAPGTYLYHCTIHRGMYGEVDVRRVTLDPLPSGAVAATSHVAVSGRTADPSAPVLVQSDTGTGFITVASVWPQPDGSWRATLTASATGQLRASSNGSFSQTRRLLVVTRTVQARRTARGIVVRVAPASAHALVALQFYLRDRFGWWIVAQRRLDRRSSAVFAFGHYHGLRARVLLLGPDHWTPLAISRVLRIG